MKDIELLKAENDMPKWVTEIPSTKEYKVNILCSINAQGLYAVKSVVGKPQDVVNFVCALTKVNKTKLGNIYWYDNFMKMTGYTIEAMQDLRLAICDIVPAENVQDVMHVIETHK